MIFRTVGRKHPIPRAIFTGEAAAFWAPIDLSPVPYALVVYDEPPGIPTAEPVRRRPVAWLRYAFTKRGAHFWDAGVWVDAEYRRAGIAHELYFRALKTTGAKTVTICTVSKLGRAMVASLVHEITHVGWQVEPSRHKVLP